MEWLSVGDFIDAYIAHTRSGSRGHLVGIAVGRRLRRLDVLLAKGHIDNGKCPDTRRRLGHVPRTEAGIEQLACAPLRPILTLEEESTLDVLAAIVDVRLVNADPLLALCRLLAAGRRAGGGEEVGTDLALRVEDTQADTESLQLLLLGQRAILLRLLPEDSGDHVPDLGLRETLAARPTLGLVGVELDSVTLVLRG